jgi:Lrp/AsnC family transcriptional regulator, leucine-responsive regulatory protein
MSLRSMLLMRRLTQQSFVERSGVATMTPEHSESGKTLDSPAASAEALAGTGLDRYDVAILQQLQQDARLSNSELGSRIGLSAAPTWRRVKWLEQQGYITGYRAEIDRRKIGLGVLAFVRVDAERNNAEATKVLEDTIRGLPEVVACHYISGAGTFELQVLATDLEAFSRWTMQTLFKLPNVKDLHTSFSLGEVKAGAALPLGHLSPPSPQSRPGLAPAPAAGLKR